MIHLSTNQAVHDYGVVKHEHVQNLGYVSHFIRTLEKCSANIDELLLACWGSVNENFSSRILKSCFHITFSTVLLLL